MSEQEPKLDGPDLAAVVRRERRGRDAAARGHSGPITMLGADYAGSGRQCAGGIDPAAPARFSIARRGSR